MSRIRTIKPEFWRHEELSDLPEATHMLAAALLNYADDEGYFNANPMLVKAECSPLREPSVSIHDSLIALSDVGYLVLGEGRDGRSYGHIVHFLDHQRINRPVPSKIKGLEIDWGNSSTAHTQLSEPSPPEGNREGNREGKNTPPSQASGGAGSYPEDFEKVWAAYKPIASKNSTKADAAKAHERLNKADREACLTGVQRYASWLVAERLKRADTPAKHLATFIHKRGWEPFIEDAAAAAAIVATEWVGEEDSRWPALADRYCGERGKPPPIDANRGWRFPTDWLKAAA